MGYSLKLHTVVNSLKGGLKQLSIPFSTPILNLPIQDLTVKVSLSRLWSGHSHCQENSFTFSMMFPIAEGVRAAMQVVLPEGSSHIEADFPFDVEQSRETKYTYLDTYGRPVLVLKKQNVVPDHNMPLKVTYKFASIAMLQEPLLLVGTFFAFFCALIVYTRFNFRLSPIKSL